MLPSWCQDTVTVLRAPWVTKGGRRVRDWGSAVPHRVGGCTLQQSSTETSFDGSARDASESAATLLCPPGSDVREGDRVERGEERWLVDGVPEERRSPSGCVSHLHVRLREWRG